jgi:tricorn protease
MRALIELALLAAVPLAPLAGQTLLLRQPTVSERHIAFAYANNIWVVDRAGGEARRLTSFQGQTQTPSSRPTGGGWRSAASTAGTPTSTSSRSKAASRSGSPGIRSPTS